MTQLLTRSRRRSRFLTEWSAPYCLERPDLALDALSGQLATFTRAAGTTALDTAGATIQVPHSQAAFEWKDLDGDGLKEATVLLGTSDRLYLAYAGRPAERTFYVEMTDKTATGAGVTRIMEIGDSASATGYLNIRRSATGYDATHNNGTTTVTGTVTVTVVAGDRIELRLYVAATGALTLAVSQNGATEVVGSATGSNTFAAAWNQARLAIGSDFAGGNRATQAVHLVREHTGNRSLAFLRAG